MNTIKTRHERCLQTPRTAHLPNGSESQYLNNDFTLNFTQSFLHKQQVRHLFISGSLRQDERRRVGLGKRDCVETDWSMCFGHRKLQLNVKTENVLTVSDWCHAGQSTFSRMSFKQHVSRPWRNIFGPSCRPLLCWSPTLCDYCSLQVLSVLSLNTHKPGGFVPNKPKLSNSLFANHQPIISSTFTNPCVRV